MKQETKIIKLSLKEAKELYKNADSTFKQFLETNFSKRELSSDIRDVINSLEDVCELLGIDENELYIYPKNTKDKFKRYINACSIIPKIVSAYNENKGADFTNHYINKHLPYYKQVSSGWVYSGCSVWGSSATGSVSHHYTKSENCIDACKKFNDIYIDYFSFNG